MNLITVNRGTLSCSLEAVCNLPARAETFGCRQVTPSLLATVAFPACADGCCAKRGSGTEDAVNIGALIITYAIFGGVPYYIYSIMGPKTLLYLVRPLLYITVTYYYRSL